MRISRHGLAAALALSTAAAVAASCSRDGIRIKPDAGPGGAGSGDVGALTVLEGWIPQ